MDLKNLENIIKRLKKEDYLSWVKNVYDLSGGQKGKISNHQVQVYLVGGAVRDALLGCSFDEINDYDFVVRGIDIESLGKLLEKKGKVNLVGKHFGVFKFKPKGVALGEPFDVALPRKEVSLVSGAYRDFKVDFDKSLKIEDDLARRDFTVNAMAYELSEGNLVDTYQGSQDLTSGLIKTVGNAYERFEEDYSRILRALRFACQLDWQIEQTTFEAIKKLISKINKISKINNERVVPYEVIASELLKAFLSESVKAFDLYDKSGAFKQLMPELLEMKGCPQPENWHSEGDVWQHTRLCLKNLQSDAFMSRFKQPIVSNEQHSSKDKYQQSSVQRAYGAELVMAVLWHDVGKPYTIQTPENDQTDRIRFNNHDVTSAKMAREKFEQLRLSSAPDVDFETDRAVWLIDRHHLYDTKTVNEMKNSTIEKYFFSQHYSGEDLLKMGFIDMSSSIWKEGGNSLGNFELMLKRINELKKMGKGRRLPEKLLDGNEVMMLLEISPGQKVGQILDDLREQQLAGKIKTKKQAVEYIKNIYL